MCRDVNINIVYQYSHEGVSGAQVGAGTLLRLGKSIISRATIVHFGGVENNLSDMVTWSSWKVT